MSKEKISLALCMYTELYLWWSMTLPPVIAPTYLLTYDYRLRSVRTLYVSSFWPRIATIYLYKTFLHVTRLTLFLLYFYFIFSTIYIICSFWAQYEYLINQCITDDFVDGRKSPGDDGTTFLLIIDSNYFFRILLNTE